MKRLGLPIAITECHLHSTREKQMRWFNEMWETLNELKSEGVDIRAITAWAIFGLHGWNRLATESYSTYEPGVFNLSYGHARPTALARLIRILTKRKVYYHPVSPINVYGESKAEAEKEILFTNPNALIVRTSNVFSPWSTTNFVAETLEALREARPVYAANDIYVSPAYTPDLANESLDLLLDNEHGTRHVATEGVTTWAALAYRIAEMAGHDFSLIKEVSINQLGLKAKRLRRNVLMSKKGIVMPTLKNALQRYLEAINNYYRSNDAAV